MLTLLELNLFLDLPGLILVLELNGVQTDASKRLKLLLLEQYPLLCGLFMSLEEFYSVFKHLNLVVCLLAKLALLEHLNAFIYEILTIGRFSSF